MAFIQKAIFYLTCLIFFAGPSLRLNIASISVPIFDVSLCFFVISQISFFKKLPFEFFIFIFWSIFSYLINTNHYQLNFQSLFYFVRLIIICLILAHKKSLNVNQSFFLKVLLAFICFGLIQYWFWPDLQYLRQYGWDPHQNRLVSTFLDPTYTGLILLFVFIYAHQHQIKLLSLVSYVCLSLTYSRSTFLSLCLGFFYLSIVKNKNYLLFSKIFILVIITIFLLPQTVGESTNLTRSSTIKAKIENYRQGINLTLEKPIIGHGYNNLTQIRSQSLDGNNHSLAGFDSSLLTLATTTGLVGCIIFIAFIKKCYWQVNIYKRTAILCLLIHSLFSNSLLYPWAVFTLLVLFN